MQIGSFGDLAQSYSMQSRNTALKTDIQRLTLELASGKVSDIRQAIGGQTAYIDDIERSLTKLDGYELASREASQFAEGMQNALSRVNEVATDFRDTLLVTPGSASGQDSSVLINQAQGSLDDVINALNTTVAGRSIFSGMATDTAPMAPKEELLAGLVTAMSGAGTVDDMLAAASAWFDDPVGFGTLGYFGSDRSLTPFSLSNGDSAEFDLRADDPALRDILRGLAIVAVADDPGLALTNTEKGELLQKSAPESVSTTGGIIDLQAKVGFSEARIETSLARQSTERAALEMARNDLLSIDPYETATELEQVQFQLQSLYAITSRMSQLSLVNFI